MTGVSATGESSGSSDQRSAIQIAASIPLALISLYGDRSEFANLVREGIRQFLKEYKFADHPDRGTKANAETIRPLILDVEVDALARLPLDVLQRAGLRGAVACVAHPETLEIVRGLQVPVVNVSNSLVRVSFPSVVMDEAAAGRLGAEHLLARGYSQFGYFGYPANPWSTLRVEAFRKTIEDTGRVCRVETWNWDKGQVASQEDYHEVNCKRIDQWLQGFSGPAGIMVDVYSGAQWVFDSCQRLRLKIPGDVAVIFATPAEVKEQPGPMNFSHVLLDPRGVGFRAMELLMKLMRGEPAPADPIRVPPLRVVEGESTSLIAVRCPELWRALQYIERNATRAITVDNVIDASGMSRRNLEIQCLKWVGRTPGNQIRQIRLAHARKLLSETDLPVWKVAQLVGFQAPKHFCRFFSEMAGLPPTAYRAQNRKPMIEMEDAPPKLLR